MSTWHHGTIDLFDTEPGGLPPYGPAPPVFRCEECAGTFSSKDALSKHRFEEHPLQRPVLLFQGRELGETPVLVTRAVTERDVHENSCDRAFVDGREIPVGSVPRRLATISSGVHRLRLVKTGVRADFNLDFCIASKPELDRVGREFTAWWPGRQIDGRAIEAFVSATEVLATVAGYVDGICEYLYGLQLKNGPSTVSRSRETYVHRFNRAVDRLASYSTPLARRISAAVEFHFNHFPETVDLAGYQDIGRAALRYAAWMGLASEGVDPPNGVAEPSNPGAADDRLPTVFDSTTKRIVHYVLDRRNDVAARREIEALLNSDPATYDALKMHVLLGEICAESGDALGARSHVRELRNVPALECWAESMLERLHQGSGR